MSKSVLCAVDVSQAQFEQSVLKTAAMLAQLDDAQLDVITVLPDFGMSVVGSFFDKGHHEKAIEKAQQLLNQCVEKTLGASVNAKTRHIVGTGNAYEVILKTAAEANTDLIVIGAHKPEFSDYLLGPNAARVVRHSNCSVYVVR